MIKQIMNRKNLLLPFLLLPLISCQSNSGTDVEQSRQIGALEQKQRIILSQIDDLEQKHKNLDTKVSDLEKRLASLQAKVTNIENQKVADNKPKPQEPDPNKKYDIPVGESFVLGPRDAKVTITEWMDFQ